MWAVASRTLPGESTALPHVPCVLVCILESDLDIVWRSVHHLTWWSWCLSCQTKKRLICTCRPFRCILYEVKKSFIVNIQSHNSKAVTQMRDVSPLSTQICLNCYYYWSRHYAMLQRCFNWTWSNFFRARYLNVLVLSSTSVENTTLIQIVFEVICYCTF